MRLVKLGVATLNQTPLDWEGNTRRVIEAVKAAKSSGVQALCLPELAVTGYGCEDAFHGLGHSARAMRHLLDIASEVGEILVVIGVPVRLQSGLYNCAAFLSKGHVHGFVAKQNLAGDGVHYEPRWFRPWPAGRIDEVEIDGTSVPIGDFILDCGDVRIGSEICEDAWVPDRPGVRLARAGCDIIMGPSASHFSLLKSPVRERIVVEGSRAFGCAYLFANALGNESGRMIFDGQCVIASAGEINARGDLFSFAEWKLETAVLDLDLLRMKRDRTMSLRPDDAETFIVGLDFEFAESKESPAPTANPLSARASGAHVKEEEFARAVSLGLFDYLRKSRSRGYVVSLSGGADSTATAVLAALAFRMAVDELGIEEVRARLPQASIDESSLCGGLLDTVYQASANSGGVTRAAARTVGEGLGARHSEWNIEELVRGYRALMENTLDRQLTWENDDIALQNIQARVRAPGIWMLANVRGALLLCTSNRSEAAVGYATMDGDTSGSIAPIAGIDKNYLRLWLQWMMTTGPDGIGPMPFLAPVCKQAPTAELRPPESKQTDEADLMPYDLLDVIERLAIRDRMEPPEVVRTLSGEWSERVGGSEKLHEYIRRFFMLWSRNQWKRERYAPSFHLDDENLDPKTWCRFPILSGGFAEELQEIEK